MASSKGALARRRGIDWERELVNILIAYGFDAERVLTETKYGNLGDVLVYDPNLLIQCKAGKQKKQNFIRNKAGTHTSRDSGNENA